MRLKPSRHPVALLALAAGLCSCGSTGATAPHGGAAGAPGGGAGSAGAGSGAAGSGGAGSGGGGSGGQVAPGTDGSVADAPTSPRDSGDVPDGSGPDPVSWGPPFVAVGYRSVRAYSPDGKTWTPAPDPAVLPAGWTGPPVDGDNQWLLRGGCWGQGKFLAVGGNGTLGLLLSSTDGQAWTLVGPQSNDDCAYGNGLWVTQIRWSRDGTNFTKVTNAANVRRIAYGDGLFVAAGDNAISYTRDGQTWKQLPIKNAAGYNHIAFGNHRFVAVYSLVRAAPIFEWDGVSDTSFTETPHPAELDGPTYDLTYGRHAFYLAGFSALYRRADGVTTWQKIPGTGAAELYNLVVTDDIFVDDRWWSTDGAQWTKATNAPPNVTRIVATPR